MASSTVLDRAVCQKTGQYLGQLLSDTYVVYVKTQNFHWNVQDARFYSLHKMLESQYEELADAIDELAERHRMLNLHAPGSMKEFLAKSTIQESNGTLTADAMLQILIEDHSSIADHIRPQITEIQGKGDEGTADLLIQRLRYHEKTSWMLRSHFTH